MRRRKDTLVAKILIKLMITTTANNTSIHFGMGHMSHRHNRLFALDLSVIRLETVRRLVASLLIS
jgi:hypothetical protein